MNPTVQDLRDLLATFESDDDDERARILRRAARAIARHGHTGLTDLAGALIGQELGSVLAGEAVSHVRTWLKTRDIEAARIAPALQVVPKTPPKKIGAPPLPEHGRDRPWRKSRW